MTPEKTPPVQILHLFPVLDKMLIDFLKSLKAEEWNAPTVAKLWKVKDVASHLLDGNLRGLSSSRDHFYGEKPENINSFSDLVGYLNKLNLDWTLATRRLSSIVLTDLLEITGKLYSEHLASLNPHEEAIFSVSWAGQDKSENWFHIAREYTEKFLHQQQIRDAVGNSELMIKELFYPFADTLMYALPYTFRNTAADTGTTVTVRILSEIGGDWTVVKTDTAWQLSKIPNSNPTAMVRISPELAWKLFSKSKSYHESIEEVEITGDRNLGQVALKMISFMA